MSEQITPPVAAQGEPAGDGELGPGGEKALAAEREARKTADRENAALKARLEVIEAEKLSELERAQLAATAAETRATELEAEIKSRDLTILRQQIGSEFKIPAELVPRIQGDTEEALRADAKSLAGFVPAEQGRTFPKPDPFQGGDGGGLHSAIDSADRAFVGQLFQKD